MRRIVIAVLALAMIAGIVAVAVVARNTPDPLAELRLRNEAVEVSSEGVGPRLGEEGADLGEGDIVRTNEDGEAQIDLFEGSLVRLDTTTEVGLSKLQREPNNNVVLDVPRGRTWHRVAELVSGSDHYTVSIGDATISVRGTTFIADCRRAPECYVVGIDGTTEVASRGQETTVETGDCVLVRRDGALEDCDEKRLGLIDIWVKENLAEDQQLELDEISAATASPSVTPISTSRRFIPAPAPRPEVPAATPAPTAEPTAEPTDEPPMTMPPFATPTPKPKATKTPGPDGCEPTQGGTPCPYPE